MTTSLPVLPATFHCAPLSCAVTRSSCAQRHQRASRPGKPGQERLTGAACCRDCVVGRAHARDERIETWPDGSPIAWREVVPHREPPTTEDLMANTKAEGKTIAHNGEELSLSAWGKRLGVSGTAIRARVERGWTESEAVSTPQGEVPPRLIAERGGKRAAPTKRAPAKSAASKKRPTTKRERPLVASSDVVAVASSVDPAALLTRLGWPSELVATTPAGMLVLVRAGAE